MQRKALGPGRSLPPSQNTIEVLSGISERANRSEGLTRILLSDLKRIHRPSLVEIVEIIQSDASGAARICHDHHRALVDGSKRQVLVELQTILLKAPELMEPVMRIAGHLQSGSHSRELWGNMEPNFDPISNT